MKFIVKQLIRLTLWRFEPDIIAVSGSAGKTLAKEAIFAVLKNNYRVRKSYENLDGEMGAFLAILGNWKKIGRPLVLFWGRVVVFSFLRLIFLPRRFYPKILILEYAEERLGDIKRLSGFIKPKICVITAVKEAPAGVDFYRDKEAAIREKAKLVENLSVYNFIILNFDDEFAASMKNKSRAKAMTFGFKDGADVKIFNFENRFQDGRPAGICFKIEHDGNFVPVDLGGVLGRPRAYAAAAGAAVGLIYGLNLVEISERLSDCSAPESRMNLIPAAKNVYIIDDSLSASPLSMAEALNVLRESKSKRRIAVLGDMLELGERATEAHRLVGKLAAESADILIAAGPRGKIIAESALENGMPKNHVLNFDSADEAAKKIGQLVKEGDLILVKASKAAGFEKVVSALIV